MHNRQLEEVPAKAGARIESETARLEQELTTAERELAAAESKLSQVERTLQRAESQARRGGEARLARAAAAAERLRRQEAAVEDAMRRLRDLEHDLPRSTGDASAGVREWAVRRMNRLSELVTGNERALTAAELGHRHNFWTLLNGMRGDVGNLLGLHRRSRGNTPCWPGPKMRTVASSRISTTRTTGAT